MKRWRKENWWNDAEKWKKKEDDNAKVDMDIEEKRRYIYKEKVTIGRKTRRVKKDGEELWWLRKKVKGTLEGIYAKSEVEGGFWWIECISQGKRRQHFRMKLKAMGGHQYWNVSRSDSDGRFDGRMNQVSQKQEMN